MQKLLNAFSCIEKLFGEIFQRHFTHMHILKKIIRNYFDFFSRVTAEICDIYKTSTFGQFCASCFIICMTLFLLASGGRNLLEMLLLVSYLMAMLFQIGQFCWFGNSLIYEVTFCDGFMFKLKAVGILIIC